MSGLCVPLSSITENGVAVDETVPADELRPEGADDLALSSVHVRGMLQLVSQEYVFRGSIAGTFEHACDRCLEMARVPFEAPVLWSFQAEAASAPPDGEEDGEAPRNDVATFRFEGHEIDLGPQVWEEASLAVPGKHLCREDCAGLCPQCGANLNVAPCACRASESMDNKGLAGLDTLLAQLDRKPTEE